MTQLTKNLNLIMQFLEDYADIRVENINWKIIDDLFDPLTGHDHDGKNSALIDPVNFEDLWRAIEELRRRVTALEERMTRNEILDEQRYQEFLRHNHEGVETLWMENFDNYDQTDLVHSETYITPHMGLLHLPADYNPNESYHWVGEPFNLNQDPDPDITPSKAVGRVIMSRKGTVIPYLIIGDNLEADDQWTHKYNGVVPGELTGIDESNAFVTLKYSMADAEAGDLGDDPMIIFLRARGKRRAGKRKIHAAWHLLMEGIEPPPMLPNEPTLDSLQEFEEGEYDILSVSDGRTVVTDSEGTEEEPIIDEDPSPNTPRPLYSGADRILSWQSDTNVFYWLDTETGEFTEIPDSDLGPIPDENLIGIAGGIKPGEEDTIWLLKSVVEEVDKPAGFFMLKHKFVKWDTGDGTFKEGSFWNAGKRFKRFFWKPFLICPTHLEIIGKKIYVITSMSYYDMLLDDTSSGSLINYYEEHDDYMWFPFAKLYGDLHRRRKKVTFAIFNPGIVGTVHSITEDGPWVCSGPAKIINGAMSTNSPTSNPWSVMDDEQIEAFEGANDIAYCGSNDEELVFYQAFVPEDGGDILTEEKYKDPAWVAAHQDVAWHGFVKYNLATQQVIFTRAKFPMKVNVGSVLVAPQKVHLDGGVEMVRQFVSTDNRLLSTPDNTLPKNTNIKYAFWIDRRYPGAVTSNNLSLRDEVMNPIHGDIKTGDWERIQTSTGNIILPPDIDISVEYMRSRRHKSRVVRKKKKFRVLSIGGVLISISKSVRVRKHHKKIRKVVKWTAAITPNTRAFQIYGFVVGSSIRVDDTVKLSYKGWSEGQPEFDPPPNLPRPADISLFGWDGSQWLHIGSLGDNRNPFTIQITNPAMFLSGIMYIAVVNRKTTNAAAKIDSKLHTEYIFVTAEKKGYIYEYEWNNMAQGNQAAVVLDCSSAGPIRDALGVEVHSVGVNVISSK